MTEIGIFSFLKYDILRSGERCSFCLFYYIPFLLVLDAQRNFDGALMLPGLDYYLYRVVLIIRSNFMK